MDELEDENLEGDPEELISPSGRYRLCIRTYATAGGGSYTRGTVVRIAGGAIVCDLERDHGIFHHAFVTRGGREYLLTGRTVTSQTIVDLDGGAEYEPTGGDDFCWVGCYPSPDGDTLAVDGCYWACPYELRFFDFTDPARGWPELRLVGAEHLEDPSNRRTPRWLDPRVVECHQRDLDGAPQERTRLERRGDEMHVIDHWISEAEQARRLARARADEEAEAWWAAFRATDPMYLRLVELVRLHELPGGTLGRQRGGRRVVEHFRRAAPRASADLRWDLDARAITVQTYDGAGNRDRELSFDHSIEGIEAAVRAIAEIFRPAPSRGVS